MWWPLDDPELLTEDAYIVTAAAGRALLRKAVKAGRRSGGEVQIMRSKRSGSVKAGNGRDGKERASSINEQQIDGALGIALFFSPFLAASSYPSV